MQNKQLYINNKIVDKLFYKLYSIFPLNIKKFKYEPIQLSTVPDNKLKQQCPVSHTRIILSHVHLNILT